MILDAFLSKRKHATNVKKRATSNATQTIPLEKVQRSAAIHIASVAAAGVAKGCCRRLASDP